MPLFRAPHDGGLEAELSEVRADLQQALADLEAANVELERRKGFADALLEIVEVGIVSCDGDGNNVVSNRGHRGLLGFADGPRLLQPEDASALVEVLDSEGRSLAVEQYPLMRALRGEALGTVELLMGPPGGPHREVVARGSQIVGRDGAGLGAVVSLTDVTAERNASRALDEERRKLTAAQRLARFGGFTYHVTEGTFTYTEQLLRTWGRPDEAEAVTVAAAMMHAEDRPLVEEIWSRVITQGGHAQYEHRIVRPDGEVRHLLTNIEMVPHAPGQPAVLHGTHLDVTELVVAELAAKRSNAFSDAVLSATPDYTFVTNLATGSIVYGSHDLDILGITAEELQELDLDARHALVHPDDQDRVRSVYADAREIGDGDVLQLRYRAMHTDGRWRWLNHRVTPFRRDSSGVVVEVLAVYRDVTDVVEAEDRVAHRALHDELTGLPNWVLLSDRLDTALARSGRDGQEVAVLFCDLDSFKRVNDTGGHTTGDAVLLEIVKRLKGAARAGDTVARVGSDEFVIVVEPWNRASSGEQSGMDSLGELPDRFLAVRIADRVVESVRQPISVNGVSHVVTVSIGITYARVRSGEGTDRTTADQMLQDADAAMYRAKSRGKDRYALFENELRTDLVERGRVEQVLRRALQPPDGLPTAGSVPMSQSSMPTLTAAYQPIFDSGSGALVGFEALARLTNADGVTSRRTCSSPSPRPPEPSVRWARPCSSLPAVSSMLGASRCRASNASPWP